MISTFSLPIKRNIISSSLDNLVLLSKTLIGVLRSSHHLANHCILSPVCLLAELRFGTNYLNNMRRFRKNWNMGIPDELELSHTTLRGS